MNVSDLTQEHIGAMVTLRAGNRYVLSGRLFSLEVESEIEEVRALCDQDEELYVGAVETTLIIGGVEVSVKPHWIIEVDQ